MDHTHIAKVVQARQRLEMWMCTLLFNMSEAGDGTDIIDILWFVVSSSATQLPSDADELPPPFPAHYAPTKEVMALL